MGLTPDVGATLVVALDWAGTRPAPTFSDTPRDQKDPILFGYTEGHGGVTEVFPVSVPLHDLFGVPRCQEYLLFSRASGETAVTLSTGSNSGNGSNSGSTGSGVRSQKIMPRLNKATTPINASVI
jgi:hypothetical protein